MIKRSWIILVVALLLLSACSSLDELQKMSTEEAKRNADQYFAAEKYKKAIPYYKKIVSESSSAYLAESQLKLADCYFLREDYIDARFEYEEFIRQFSEHPEVGKAFFNIGLCYYNLSKDAHYDQTDTFNAIDAFTEFIDRFPFSEKVFEANQYLQKCRHKLYKKKYYNGYAYYKMSDYPSALLYLNDVIEQNKDDEYDTKALFYAAKIYLYRKDIQNAQLIFDKLLTKYPDAKETAKIQSKLNELKKELE